ncbi:RrF2 family transcriptional regulator, partial [Lactobacillus nasalidis]
MKVSTRFSDSIHLLAFLVIYKGKVTLSSSNIASSLNTSPVVVRRLMANLRDAGFIKTTHGSPDPELLREPKDISLLEIYLATEGHSPLFSIDHETNPECIVGGNIQPT